MTFCQLLLCVKLSYTPYEMPQNYNFSAKILIFQVEFVGGIDIVHYRFECVLWLARH